MSNWNLTLGLQNLRSQVNAAFPARDKASDGTIGDAAHQAGTSGHNPDDSPANAGKAEWDGDDDANSEVRAWDMDSDLRAPGVTTQQLVNHIRALPGISSVLRYLIYDHKIYTAANGWLPTWYTGPSPHTEHIHFSGAQSQAADNNSGFNFHLEDLVALTTDDKKFLTDLVNGQAAKVWAYPLEDPTSTKTPKATTPAGAYLRYNDVVNRNSASAVIAALKAATPNVDVKQLAATLAPMLAQAVIAALPADRDDITPAELQNAIVGALEILGDRPAS